MAIVLLCLLLLLLALAGWASRPSSLCADSASLSPIADPAAYLKASERQTARNFGIIDGAEKRVLWAGDTGVRTEYSFVYVHGFSATRQEIAPVPQLVAEALGANLFETRLTGHGQKRSCLSDVTAEDWLRDGAEALAIGKALGDKIVLMGTSTGATLALAMAEHADFDAVDSLVFMSPNFGPAARGAHFATGPFGPQLLRLYAGEYYAWEPNSDAHARYWTTRYPTRSIIEMLRLVKLAKALTPELKVPNALLIYSPKDNVVSVDKLLKGFDQLRAQRKKTHQVDQADSRSAHVLAGDILAPGATLETATRISEFLRGEPHRKSGGEN
ncbi:MAG: alpha/beta hydrolase [Congregibacter sp.]